MCFRRKKKERELYCDDGGGSEEAFYAWLGRNATIEPKNAVLCVWVEDDRLCVVRTKDGKPYLIRYLLEEEENEAF